MNKTVTFIVLLLGVASLFLERAALSGQGILLAINVIDFLIVALSLGQVLFEVSQTRHPMLYFRRNAFSLIFLVFFIVFFSVSKYLQFSTETQRLSSLSGIIVFRNAFILIKIFSRFQKLSVFFQNIVNHPSQTIVLSFVMVIFFGTLLLVMPFSSATGDPIPLIDGFFTATSAVCVTGLTVFDTGTRFSVVGQTIVLLLIQIGGLGIMLLSFSVLFLFKRSLSLENKLLVSYMVNEEDLRKIRGMAGKIILSTFTIEGIGATLLFLSLRADGRAIASRVFSAVFHSVSAFCNAGFALRADSVQTLSSPLPLLVIGLLIVMGGIGFSTIFDVRAYLSNRLSTRGKGKKTSLSANSSLVLRYTATLLAAGALLLYYTEHENTLAPMPVATQYLHALFQSITLRTAGFNSIPFGHLTGATLIVMIAFMFVGGAAGSTAGGIKVNTVGVIFAYFRSYLKKNDDTIIGKARVDPTTVMNAFLLFFIGVCIVNAAALILSIIEKMSYLPVLFEAVSAFATVGLSTGITPDLSHAGKITIIFLMFFGRLGPLTIFAAAASGRRTSAGYRYPRADVQIG